MVYEETEVARIDDVTAYHQILQSDHLNLNEKKYYGFGAVRSRTGVHILQN